MEEESESGTESDEGVEEIKHAIKRLGRFRGAKSKALEMLGELQKEEEDGGREGPNTVIEVDEDSDSDTNKATKDKHRTTLELVKEQEATRSRTLSPGETIGQLLLSGESEDEGKGGTTAPAQSEQSKGSKDAA